MGLASALTTALTGLTAAETQIDVIGNNLANSQTVGFKASDTVFSSQFLQTLSLGSAPTDNSGGRNPMQTGLGTQVAEIAPDFTQGTIEISSSPSDLAIQGDGFFLVESTSGERLYTRNGIFQINSESELVTVTGNRVLGFGVDDMFRLQTTQLEPLTIAIGSAAVAQATQNVFLEGTLTPTGELADTAEVIQSAVLSDAAIPRPDSSGTSASVASLPNVVGTTTASQAAGGSLAPGDTYQYRFAFVDASGTESLTSEPVSATVGVADDTIQLAGLPNAAEYDDINIYRTAAGGSDFFLLDTVPVGTANYADDGTTPLSATPLDESSLTGNYSYLVTYYRAGEPESRPSLLLGPTNVSAGRIQLADLPIPPIPPAEGGFPAYDQIRLYRNLATNDSTFYLVDTLAPGSSYTDARSDSEISDLTNPANKVIDLEGPRINSNTLLTNILKRDELDYETVFTEGNLTFEGRKGGAMLTEQKLEITAESTVQDLINFMEDSTGIRSSVDDPQNPIPGSVNNILGETAPLSTGGSLSDGRIRLVSNNGVDNAVTVGLSAFTLDDGNGLVTSPNLGFGSVQEAKGQSAVAQFLAYDSLGVPIDVRVTAVLEERTGNETIYRWFADTPDNDPLSGIDVRVGTGLIRFDGEGNVISVSNSTVSIDRRNIPSASPLEFELDVSQISGLAEADASLAAARQDGAAAGTLASFRFDENGTIEGAFSNGTTRTLGQIRLARFANPNGLDQRGQNTYAEGANSGLPVEGNPGQNGIGTLIAGAVELSNTDIGRDLVELVLATTMFRGNTRVITAAQELLEELLNLRR
jgi:flagellar hook protein FlgE